MNELKQKGRKFSIWWILYALVFVGVLFAMKYADQVFLAYVKVGSPSVQGASDLMPSNIQAFAYDQNFSEDWKWFRKSKLGLTLKGLPSFQSLLNAWKIWDQELSSFEKWILHFWKSSLMAGYSSKDKTLYLLSPIGTREYVLKWLAEMAVSHYRNQIRWIPRQFQSYRYFEISESSLFHSDFKVQFAVIHGVAVVAMGQNPDPLRQVISSAESPDKALSHDSNFVNFFAQELQKSTQTFGFVRSLNPEGTSEDLGVEWSLSVNPQKQIAIDVRLPAHRFTNGETTGNLDPLALLCHPDYLISVISTREDLKMAWDGCSTYLPSAWTAPILQQINLEALMGTSKKYWEPVFKKIGHEVFIGLGETNILSEKYRIPFPQTILAVPFNQTAIFVKALEATVLKLNQEAQANLFIRKIIQPNGEYYETRMGDSAWKKKHGLIELPVFGFANGLLIAGPSASSVEKVMQHLNGAPKSDLAKMEGINLQVNMRRAPETIRILLASLGALNSEGENVFFSPGTMRSMNEIFSVMEEFGNARIVLIPKPGCALLRATIVSN